MVNSQAVVLLLLLVTPVPTKPWVFEEVPEWMKNSFAVARTCYEYMGDLAILKELVVNREEYIRCSTKVLEEKDCYKLYLQLFDSLFKSKLFSIDDLLGKLVPVKMLKICYKHVDDLEMLRREFNANREEYIACSTNIFEDECSKIYSKLFGIILKSDGLLVCLVKVILL